MTSTFIFFAKKLTNTSQLVEHELTAWVQENLVFQENTGEQQNQILDLQEAAQIPEREVKQRELTHTYRVKPVIHDNQTKYMYIV